MDQIDEQQHQDEAHHAEVQGSARLNPAQKFWTRMIAAGGNGIRSLCTWIGGYSWSIVLGLVWLLGLAGLIVWGAAAHGGATASASLPKSTCPAAVAPRAGGHPPATITPYGNPNGTVVLGRSLTTLPRTFEFTIDDPKDLLVSNSCPNVEVSPFLRSTNDTQLDQRYVQVSSQRKNNTRLLVTVTFRREHLELGPPGTYTGTLSVVDPAVVRFDVPMTVTMSYPIWQIPAAIVWAMLLPSAVYVWLVSNSFKQRDEQAENAENQLRFGEFARFSQERNGFLTLMTGVAAALAVYGSIYLTSATWDLSWPSVLALVTATFAAFGTAGTTIRAAGADRGSQ